MTFVEKLKERVKEKHDKASDEGRALQRLRQIRVLASPGWQEGPVALRFLFIRGENDDDFEGTDWSELRERWLALMPPKDRFRDVDGLVATLDELTASDYVHSDPLDFDHLSSHKSPTKH